MKIGMISLGCPKNLVDSEVMLGLAQQHGHQLTRDAAEADVLIVNTCAFIDKAKQESIDTILEMAEHKKTGACRKLIVTGCMAERYRDELREQIPGDRRRARHRRGAGDRRRDRRVRSAGPSIRTRRYVPLLRVERRTDRSAHRRPPRPLRPPRPCPPTSTTPTRRACWPRRGTTPTSRSPKAATTSAPSASSRRCAAATAAGRWSRSSARRESLAARGVKELLLISQDTSFYGIDRGERGALARLLRALNRVDGLEWIRMLYLYPTTIGDDVLDAMAESDKVCNYIDLPLQHASDAVLKRMKRPGTRASYERLLDRIRAGVPGVTLRTTFIVGFPGETDADAAELQSFVEAVRFDHVGVFTYSHEEGTSAHGLDDDVPARGEAAAAGAADEPAEADRGAGARRRASAARSGCWSTARRAEHDLVLRGRLEGQAPDIDPLVYLTECDPVGTDAGQFIEAEIVGSRGYDLLARPLTAAPLASTSAPARLRVGSTLVIA